ncbi:MAG: hypothetical protein J6K25_15575 [Thermoguttaceae bacterium]|nr:hypothetical protein [Thermoguttaceae bacterium]
MAFDIKQFRALPPEEQAKIADRAYSNALPFLIAEDRRELRRLRGAKAKGRMPATDEERRDHKIHVRVNDAELEPLQAFANARGLSLAAAVRTLALTAVATNDAETSR